MRTYQTPDNTKSGFPGWDSTLGAVVSGSQAELDCNSQHFERNELSEGRGLNVYNYMARVYDPQIGRWWSADPLTSLQESFSAYHFCYNNPVMFTDKTGLIPEDTELRSVDFSSMYSSNTLTQMANAGMHLLNTPSAREIKKRVEDAHRKGKDFGYDRHKKEWGYYDTEHRMSWDENPIKGPGQPTHLRSFETINTWTPLLNLKPSGQNDEGGTDAWDLAGYVVDAAIIAVDVLTIPSGEAIPLIAGRKALWETLKNGYALYNVLEMSRGKTKMQGGRQNKRDKGFKGLPEDFKKWAGHGQKSKGEPDIPVKEVQKLYKQWISEGRPTLFK